MQSTLSAQPSDQQIRLLNFLQSETEKIYMVIGAEELGLAKFMCNYAKTVIEKGDILLFQYNIWPREHSRHFLYRWLVETASGQACQTSAAWADFVDANPQLKTQLTLLKERDQRPLEVRFLEAIRFVAEKLNTRQVIALNIMPLAPFTDPSLVDFFKSILRLLPARAKMIVGQCQQDVLACQTDFCPSNRMLIESVDPGEREMLLERYYSCYHDQNISGDLMRTLVYLAQPLGFEELSRFANMTEDETRETLAADEFEGLVAPYGKTQVRLAYPRMFFPQKEAIRRTMEDDMAELNQRVLAYYQERLAIQPDADAALGHSLGVYRLSDAEEIASRALTSYHSKLGLGAGEMSEMELQLALERIDAKQEAMRGRLSLALAEVRETLGRNRDALEALEAAIEILQKTDQRPDLQVAFELKGRAAFALRDIDVARKAFEDALSLARELDQAPLIADILSQSGYLYFTIRQLDVAEKQYQEALELYRGLTTTNPDQSHRGMATQLSNLGHVAYARSAFDQAENYHRQAIEIYTQLEDKKHIAGQWGYLGHTHFAAREYTKAINAYEQAAEYDESAGNPLMAAQRYANMGHTMYAKREPEEAQRFFETALEKYKTQNNASGEAAQYSNLGLVKGDQGEFDRAVEYFNNAQNIYEKLGDQINAVTQMIRLGHVRRGQNDLKAAKTHYKEAMERYHSLNYSLGEGDTALELAQVNTALGEYDEADEHFNRAKEIFAQLGHKEKEAMSLVLLAQVRKAQEKMDAGLSLLNEAAGLYKQLENPLGMANVSFQIGLLYFDQKQYDAAEQHYRDALATFEKKEDQEGASNVLANLGTLHYETKDFAKARDELKGALAKLRMMQHPMGLAGVLVNLSFVHEAQENYKEAYDCLKEALDLYHQMKLLKEIKMIEQRLTDLERQADLSLERMRGELHSGPTGRPSKSNKVKRNDPCPCGSGKKAKKCCHP